MALRLRVLLLPGVGSIRNAHSADVRRWSHTSARGTTSGRCSARTHCTIGRQTGLMLGDTLQSVTKPVDPNLHSLRRGHDPAAAENMDGWVCDADNPPLRSSGLRCHDTGANAVRLPPGPLCNGLVDNIRHAHDGMRMFNGAFDNACA